MTNILSNIFSVRNIEDDKNRIYKKVTILGISFKFLNKYKTITKKISELATTKDVEEICYKYYCKQKADALAKVMHPETFSEYKNKFINSETVIVACGPTTSYYAPFKNCIHLGVNRSFMQDKIQLDYLFIQDYLKGDNDMQLANEYKGNNCVKFYGIIPEYRANSIKTSISVISDYDMRIANAKRYILEDKLKGDWNKMIDIEPIADMGGSVFSVLQFLLYTGTPKIYLVGCDCSKDGHFHQEPNGKNFITPDLTSQYDYWVSFKEFLDSKKIPVEIISVNPVGLKGLFKDVYTQNYVDAHPELKDEDTEIIE